MYPNAARKPISGIHTSFSNSTILITNKTELKLYCMYTGAKNGEVFTTYDIGKIHDVGLDGTNGKELIGVKANQSFVSTDPIITMKSSLIFQQ